jgi:aspartate aminotransferase
MLTLSTKIHDIEESQTLAITARAKRMQAEGLDVVSLTAGEPDFPTPQHVKHAAINAIEQNFTKYTPNAGMQELIEAIIGKFSREDNLHFGHNQILVSTGAKQCIYNVLQAICNRGDHVVILAPYWVSYPEMVKLADAKPVFVAPGNEEMFKPNLQALRRAITANTKALIINSPNNPSGVVYTQSELEAIGEIVREKNIFVISDEIYEKVVYDKHKHFSIGSIKEIREQVITVNGVSKAFAMTGWRIGYAGGPVAVMQAAAKVQTQVTSNANSIAQKAALAAITGPTDAREAMVHEFTLRRDFVYRMLKTIPDVKVSLPGGAFYFLFDVSAYYGKKMRSTFVHNSTDMAMYLLDHHHVGTVAGAAFGDDNCIRLSFACSMSDLEKGMLRIKAGLEALH